MSLSAILSTFDGEKAVVANESGGYTEKTKEGISVKGVLQRGTLKMLRERPPWRAGQTFRPSGITYSYCRRLKVAQLAGKIEIFDEPKRPKEQLTLDMGKAIHDIIQGRFWDIGILKGSYKCIKCDKIYHDLVSPTHCPVGGPTHTKKFLKYKEVIYKQPEYQVSGRCDGILMIEGEEHLMDIKSIQNRLPKSNERQFCFEDLEENGPKSDHIVQLTLYMWMSGIHNGHLLYVSKNNHMIKTYHIPYDYSVIDPYLKEIEHLLTLAQSVKAGNRVELPPCCGREKCPCETI